MLDEITLRRLYLEEQRPIREIAALLHLPTRSVYDALIRYRIPRRPASFRSARNEVADTPFDEASLRHLYLDEERSIRAIAEIAHVSTRAVYDALMRYGIPRRTVGQRPSAPAQALGASDLIDEAGLRRLYEEEHQSIEQIAATLACSASRIRNALVRWGITRRPRGRPSGAT